MVQEKQKARLLEMVNKTPKNTNGAVRNAWYHIEKAKQLLGIDNEMAAFRAITAEEEAAAGIIYALKAINYDNANLLSTRDHKHKSGIWHLLMIISEFMRGLDTYEQLNVVVSEGKNELLGKLVLSFPSPIPGDNRFVYPTPPLDFSISSDNKKVSFKKQADELASKHNKEKLEKFLSKEANLRNELLYATPEGYPTIQKEPTGFVANREHRVLVLTYVYLLISQYKQNQLFVQQSLDAYLKMIDRKDASHLNQL